MDIPQNERWSAYGDEPEIDVTEEKKKEKMARSGGEAGSHFDLPPCFSLLGLREGRTSARSRSFTRELARAVTSLFAAENACV